MKLSTTPTSQSKSRNSGHITTNSSLRKLQLLQADMQNRKSTKDKLNTSQKHKLPSTTLGKPSVQSSQYATISDGIRYEIVNPESKERLFSGSESVQFIDQTDSASNLDRKDSDLTTNTLITGGTSNSNNKLSTPSEEKLKVYIPRLDLNKEGKYSPLLKSDRKQDNLRLGQTQKSKERFSSRLYAGTDRQQKTTGMTLSEKIKIIDKQVQQKADIKRQELQKSRNSKSPYNTERQGVATQSLGGTLHNPLSTSYQNEQRNQTIQHISSIVNDKLHESMAQVKFVRQSHSPQISKQKDSKSMERNEISQSSSSRKIPSTTNIKPSHNNKDQERSSFNTKKDKGSDKKLEQLNVKIRRNNVNVNAVNENESIVKKTSNPPQRKRNAKRNDAGDVLAPIRWNFSSRNARNESSQSPISSTTPTKKKFTTVQSKVASTWRKGSYTSIKKQSQNGYNTQRESVVKEIEIFEEEKAQSPQPEPQRKAPVAETIQKPKQPSPSPEKFQQQKRYQPVMSKRSENSLSFANNTKEETTNQPIRIQEQQDKLIEIIAKKMPQLQGQQQKTIGKPDNILPSPSNPTLLGNQEQVLLQVIMKNLRLLFKESKQVMNFEDPKADFDQFLSNLRDSQMLEHLLYYDQKSKELEEITLDEEQSSYNQRQDDLHSDIEHQQDINTDEDERIAGLIHSSGVGDNQSSRSLLVDETLNSHEDSLLGLSPIKTNPTQSNTVKQEKEYVSLAQELGQLEDRDGDGEADGVRRGAGAGGLGDESAGNLFSDNSKDIGTSPHLEDFDHDDSNHNRIFNFNDSDINESRETLTNREKNDLSANSNRSSLREQEFTERSCEEQLNASEVEKCLVIKDGTEVGLSTAQFGEGELKDLISSSNQESLSRCSKQDNQDKAARIIQRFYRQQKSTYKSQNHLNLLKQNNDNQIEQHKSNNYYSQNSQSRRLDLTDVSVVNYMEDDDDIDMMNLSAFHDLERRAATVIQRTYRYYKYKNQQFTLQPKISMFANDSFIPEPNPQTMTQLIGNTIYKQQNNKKGLLVTYAATVGYLMLSKFVFKDKKSQHQLGQAAQLISNKENQSPGVNTTLNSEIKMRY